MKRGLPGISFMVTGLLVAVISYALGTKFFLFQLLGIALFCYGCAKLYILKDKVPEKVTEQDHHFRLATHRLAHPQAEVKSCYFCNTLLPFKAKFCMHCGTQL
ncbi:hypothetical protein HY639_01910 [Candidatus Woesearchaeota archaeon]|nr:hypothetical protein [Candidatus Woesearchaeota archaeon]